MENENGFVAFVSVLIISVVALSIASSVTLLGIGEAQTSLTFQKGQVALISAQGCVEEALLRLRRSGNYSGGSLNVGSGTCTISITSNGDDRTINVTATVIEPQNYIRSLRVSATRRGNTINIVSWEEI